MIVLFESFLLTGFADRPNLGCAMLIASCRKQNINVQFVNAQVSWPKNILINYADELWTLISQLDDFELDKMEIKKNVHIVRNNGKTAFLDKLKGLYIDFYQSENPKVFFDADKVCEIRKILQLSAKVYTNIIKKNDGSRLKIIKHYVDEALKNNPTCIGFSLQCGFDIISRQIRQNIKDLTDIPIVIGGALTPFLDLNSIDKISKKENFDYLMVGEGEEAFPLLVKSLEEKKKPNNISNVVFCERGQPVYKGFKVIDDLNILPTPDFSLFDLDSYFAPQKVLPIQTSRGCSWEKCNFCVHSKIYQKKYRVINVSRVRTIMQELQDIYKCSYFTLHDEELPASRAKKISEELCNNNLTDISIYTYARMTSGYKDIRTLSSMKKAGFNAICWGMESGCQRVLDSMGKGTNISTMHEILKLSSQCGIANFCFVLFGFPSETKDEALETVSFLSDNSKYIDLIMSQTFRLAKHSAVYKNPKNWGVNIRKDGSFTVDSGMSTEEIDKFYRKFIARRNLNLDNLSVGYLKNVFASHNMRVLYFLTNSHGFLSAEKSLELLNIGEMSEIYPIIPREVKSEKDGKFFYKTNMKKSFVINCLTARSKEKIDSFIEKCIQLSDGRLNIKEIVSQASQHCEASDQELCRKRGYAFFTQVFSDNGALGFLKSWN